MQLCAFRIVLEQDSATEEQSTDRQRDGTWRTAVICTTVFTFGNGRYKHAGTTHPFFTSHTQKRTTPGHEVKRTPRVRKDTRRRRSSISTWAGDRGSECTTCFTNTYLKVPFICQQGVRVDHLLYKYLSKSVFYLLALWCFFPSKLQWKNLFISFNNLLHLWICL